MPDTDPNRWKMVSIVAVAVALISIMLNVYFYISDNSEIAPCVDDVTNNSNMSNVSNVSDENETKMRRIAVVEIMPGSTTEID